MRRQGGRVPAGEHVHRRPHQRRSHEAPQVVRTRECHQRRVHQRDGGIGVPGHPQGVPKRGRGLVAARQRTRACEPRVSRQPDRDGEQERREAADHPAQPATALAGHQRVRPGSFQQDEQALSTHAGERSDCRHQGAAGALCGSTGA